MSSVACACTKSGSRVATLRRTRTVTADYPVRWRVARAGASALSSGATASDEKHQSAGYCEGVSLRSLSGDERALLDFLLSADFTGRDQLREQAVSVQTAGSSCDCGCPSFYLNPDRQLPPAQVDEPVPVEAHGHDPGGHLVGVMLFVDEDGYLADIEVFGYESSEFSGIPSPDSLKISDWTDPDEHGS